MKDRVGRYGVDLAFFEAVALPSLEQALRERELIVIDEIGRMELLSRRFQDMVIRIMDQDTRHLLGVIHQARDPFSTAVRKRRDVEVITVNLNNRHDLSSQIIMRFQGR